MIAEPAHRAEMRLDLDPRAAPNLSPPPGNPRFPLYDSLRAIAALAVFLGHTITQTYNLSTHRHLVFAAIQVADQGVAIFFLISGFLLYRPFVVARRAGRPLRITAYARRRVLRIVPAYWVALTILLAAGLVAGVTWGNAWIFYLFGQSYSVSTISSGIGVAWTLCIEVTFYAALPLFALAAASLGRGRRSVRADVVLLVVLAVGSVAFRGHFRSLAQLGAISSLPGTFLWFALGMGLAVLSVAEDCPLYARASRLVAERAWLPWAVALAASVLLYYLTNQPQRVVVELAVYVLYGVIALLVLLPGTLGTEGGGLPRRILRLRGLAWIGLISYAFYLYHTIVIAQIEKHTRVYPVVLVVSALVACVCAALSYYLVERPLMLLPLHRPSSHQSGR